MKIKTKNQRKGTRNISIETNTFGIHRNPLKHKIRNYNI